MTAPDPHAVLWFARALVASEFKVVPTPTYAEQMAQAEEERQYLAARNTAVEWLRDIERKEQTQ